MKQVVAANLFRGKEAVGGRLHFEEQRMVFKSHAFNIQTGETVILYSDIADVHPRNTLGLVPNGISVILKNGVEHKVVVWNRKEIIAFLREKAGLSPQVTPPAFSRIYQNNLDFS